MRPHGPTHDLETRISWKLAFVRNYWGFVGAAVERCVPCGLGGNLAAVAFGWNGRSNLVSVVVACSTVAVGRNIVVG